MSKVKVYCDKNKLFKNKMFFYVNHANKQMKLITFGL